MNTLHLDSPLGPLVMTIRHNRIVSLKLASKEEIEALPTSPEHPSLEQLEAYFAGKRTSFDVLFETEGTPFQRAVWKAAAEIPFGETMTYGEIAAKIGMPKAARAVGQALTRNPVAIVVPCHRVVSSSGKIGGYAWGPKRKKWLLAHEKKSAPQKPAAEATGL